MLTKDERIYLFVHLELSVLLFSAIKQTDIVQCIKYVPFITIHCIHKLLLVCNKSCDGIITNKQTNNNNNNSMYKAHNISIAESEALIVARWVE